MKTFPIKPEDGYKYDSGNIVYVYNASKNSWDIPPAGSGEWNATLSEPKEIIQSVNDYFSSIELGTLPKPYKIGIDLNNEYFSIKNIQPYIKFVSQVGSFFNVPTFIKAKISNYSNSVKTSISEGYIFEPTKFSEFNDGSPNYKITIS